LRFNALHRLYQDTQPLCKCQLPDKRSLNRVVGADENLAKLPGKSQLDGEFYAKVCKITVSFLAVAMTALELSLPCSIVRSKALG
jgi:hypothetical protein